MLNRKTRKLIESHFYNYNKYKSLYKEKETDIINSGLTARYDSFGCSGGMPGNPIESKVFRLLALDKERCWATVVLSTFTAFRFEPEYNIMVALYIERRNRKEIFANGLWETTYYRWREKWLNYAYKCACSLNLL